MKKSTKKLALTRETVKELDEIQGKANPTNSDCVSACFGLECQNEFDPR